MIDRAGQIWNSTSRSAFAGGETSVRTIVIMESSPDGMMWKHRALVTISNGHVTTCDIVEAIDCLLEKNPNWRRLT